MKTQPVKITFKRHAKATGLSRVMEIGQYVDLKIKGQVFGSIIPPHYSNSKLEWKVSVMLVCEEHPGWKNVTFAKKHESVEDARKWCLENLPKFIENNQIRFSE